MQWSYFHMHRQFHKAPMCTQHYDHDRHDVSKIHTFADAVLATQQSILHESGNCIQNFTPLVPAYFRASQFHFARSLARS